MANPVAPVGRQPEAQLHPLAQKILPIEQRAAIHEALADAGMLGEFTAAAQVDALDQWLALARLQALRSAAAIGARQTQAVDIESRSSCAQSLVVGDRPFDDLNRVRWVTTLIQHTCHPGSP